MFNLGTSPGFNLNLLMKANAASLANAAARPRLSAPEPESNESDDDGKIEGDDGDANDKDGDDDANKENEDDDERVMNNNGNEELYSRMLSGMFSCTGSFGKATITISPGRLGMSLKVIEGWATVTKVAPACLLRGQVQVGDVIFTVDGKIVTSVEDVKRGRDRARKLGIVKRGNDWPDWTAPTERDYVQAGVRAGAVPQRQLDVAAREHENLRAPPSDSKFPNLEALGAAGDDILARRRREALLAELFERDFDILPKALLKRYSSQNRGKVKVRGEEGRFQEYQVVCVPRSRKKDVEKDVESQTHSKEQLNNLYFHNEGSDIFDKIIEAWASFCDGNDDDAAKMILFYMAGRFPSSYVENVKSTTEEDVVEMATKKQAPAPRQPNGKRRWNRPRPHEPRKLPLDYVSYDGTADLHWNTKYGELLRYREQFGDCRVYSKSVLGTWVGQMRSNRRVGVKNLTPKRIQLLDDIGFLWCGVREGEEKRNIRGQTRHHRAVAAKIMFPQLTIRECLYLGGYEDEELNVIPNPKHSWRTVYVARKDTVRDKVRKYDAAWATRHKGNKTSWTEIFEFVALLEGDDEDRFRKVFGDCGDYLPQFLEAAEERASRGVFEKELRGSATRTDADAVDDEERQPPSKASDDEEQEPTAEEQADSEAADEPFEPPDLGTG